MTTVPTSASWRPRSVATLVALVACLAFVRCGGTSTPTSPSPQVPTPPVSPQPVPPVVPSPPQTFVGAGDIGWCGSPGVALTARLLDAISGTVFTTGDNAYMTGTAEEFRTCYEPSWGRHKARTRPVPGNHEYEGAGPGPYFDYFGGAAGPYGLGYYSFELGDWHVIALNTMLDLREGSAQTQWLRNDLIVSKSKCTVAYWHYPLFTSRPAGNSGTLRPIWKILMDFGVDVVLNGHDHLYERFAPQDENGLLSTATGIREFIVGTGGAPAYPFGPTTANSERRITNVFGVLKLTLSSGSYDWQFIQDSGAVSDSGSGTCH